MYLAEINEENICIGVKQVNDYINDGKHIKIDGLDRDYLWRKYEDGDWSEEKYFPDVNEPPSLEEEILFENKYQTLLLEMEAM